MLVATYGLVAMLASRRLLVKAASVVLLLSAATQFGWLYADYMTRYRVTSAPWFGGDRRGAVAEVMARAQGVPVFLDGGTPIERYWRFYALADGGQGLVGQPTYFDAATFSPASVPAGALLVCLKGDAVCGVLERAADWRRVTSRQEPDGTTSFEIFEKAQRQ